MGLDFVELRDDFFDVFDPSSLVYFDFVRNYSSELNLDDLWSSCYQIENIWSDFVHKHKNSIKWVFFGDYPTDVTAYLYFHPIYGKKLIKNHIERGIVLFDLIPLTITYKNIKKDLELIAYSNIFKGFEKFRRQKWSLLKPLINTHTKFGLTYTRQNEYKDLLQEECEKILGIPVEIKSWSREYGASCDIFDRIEKMALIFE